MVTSLISWYAFCVLLAGSHGLCMPIKYRFELRLIKKCVNLCWVICVQSSGLDSFGGNFGIDCQWSCCWGGKNFAIQGCWFWRAALRDQDALAAIAVSLQNCFAVAVRAKFHLSILGWPLSDTLWSLYPALIDDSALCPAYVHEVHHWDFAYIVAYVVEFPPWYDGTGID